MKKIMLFLALSFAICSISFGQTIVKEKSTATAPQKLNHSGMKHKKQDGSDAKNKGKHAKHKHKHKNKDKKTHHKKKHKKKNA